MITKVLRNSSHTYNIASQRLLCSRCLDHPTPLLEHNRLFEMQSQNCNLSIIDSPWKNNLKNVIDFYNGKILEECKDIFDYDTLQEEYVNQPHTKKQLRIAALAEINELGERDDKTYTQKAVIKLKTLEIAKPNKRGRMIGDFGAPGSIVGGAIMSCVKEGMVNRYEGTNFVMVFVKSADVSTLSSLMLEMYTSMKNMIIFHSDDSSVTIMTVEGPVTINFDIKSCDSSHGFYMFDLVRRVTRGHVVLERCIDSLIAQCELPAVFRNPEDWAEKFVAKPFQPVLYSGSSLTTTINNVATSVIFSRFFHTISGVIVTKANVEALLHSAAYDVGYLATLTVCNQIEDLQFLKHSLCAKKAGGYVAVLNPGVILRTMGQCVGDIPIKGKMSFAEKANIYMSGVVLGWEHAGNHTLLNTLRRKYALKVDKIDTKIHFKSDDELDVNSLLRRYNVGVEEFEEFLNILELAKLGDEIQSSVVSKILSVDYDYEKF